MLHYTQHLKYFSTQMRSYQILWKDSSVFSSYLERIQSAMYASLSSPCGLCCTERLSLLPFVQEHWLPHVPQHTDASQLRTLNILRHFSVLQLPAHCHPSGELLSPSLEHWSCPAIHKVKPTRVKDSWYHILNSSTLQTSVSMCWVNVKE